MKNLAFLMALCSLVSFSMISKARADDYSTLRLRGRSLTLNQNIEATRPYIGVPSRSYLASISDVSERKRRERELLHALKTRGDIGPGETEAARANLKAGQTFLIDKEVWNPFMREVQLYFMDSHKNRFALMVRVQMPTGSPLPRGEALTVDSIVSAVPVQGFVERYTNIDELYTFGTIR
jgi:hypothetical protein